MPLPFELEMPAPIGLQPGWLKMRKSRKVGRVGRRGTKTRFAMIASIMGHGPLADDADPTSGEFPGILRGDGDVVWISQDYGQLTTVIWKEEILPRFQHLADQGIAHIDNQNHTLSLPTIGKRGGNLLLRSAEAIDSVRGVGNRLVGVIIDEAAHLDLQRALLDVIMPACLDHGAWIILLSTTNAGLDGNRDKRVPSYFNLICEEIRAGTRSDDWWEFTGTAFDNPKLNHTLIQELINEYPPGSVALEQEVYARLLRGGIGFALPHLSEEKHIIPKRQTSAYWPRFAGFDWGFNHPYALVIATMDTDGVIYVVDTITARQQTPEQIADHVGRFLNVSALGSIHSGSDVKHNKGRSIGYEGPTIFEVLVKRGWKLVMDADGPGSRVLELDNLRRYIGWDAYVDRQGIEQPAEPPRLFFFDTPGNRWLVKQCQELPLDPKNPEDAEKIDADSGGRGGDDGYEALRRCLMSRPIKPMVEKPPLRQDQNPGIDWKKGKPAQRVDAQTQLDKFLEKAAKHDDTLRGPRVPKW